MLNFPVMFNLTAGQRYALEATLDAANNPILVIVNEGAIGASSVQRLTLPTKVLPGVSGSKSPVQFAPAR